jgi:hypothetical protein
MMAPRVRQQFGQAKDIGGLIDQSDGRNIDQNRFTKTGIL